jgi:hypothetical protein
MLLQELICQFEMRRSNADYAESSVSNIREEPLPVQRKIRRLNLSITNLECKAEMASTRPRREIKWAESGSVRMVATSEEPAAR